MIHNKNLIKECRESISGGTKLYRGGPHQRPPRQADAALSGSMHFLNLLR
jgi:hypothetical protein